MHATLLTLLGYSAWVAFLLCILAGLRTYVSLSGQRAANDFSPTGTDVSPFSGRLCRAHANAYEFFPIIGGVLAVALISGNTQITDPLAYWVLAARAGQSLVHLVSTSVPAVFLRFGLFLVQVGIVIYWIWMLYQALT